MDEHLARRVRGVVAGHVGIDADRLTSPGSTIVADADQGPDGWVTLFPAVGHVVAEVPAPLLDAVQTATRHLEPGQLLTTADVKAAWPEREIELDTVPVTVLSARQFRPVAPAGPATARLLGELDRDAFESFHARCSEEDREEALVDIDHLAAGVFVDGRIVAVASTFDWCGFEDIGVLTDPDHRRRRHGAAAVSEVCRAVLEGPRLPSYRYFEGNVASRRLAAALGFAPIGTLVRIRPAPR